MTDSNRPLSPHLQVYRLPMLALLSITHRITGFGVALAAILIPLVLTSLLAGADTYECLHAQLSAWYGQLVLFLVSASLIFHLLNGIRHLVWDLGLNLKVRHAEISGYVVITLTILLTAALWALACTLYRGGSL